MRKEDRCGVLLAPALSGVEAIGGSLHEYRSNNSRARAVAVMTEFFSLDTMVAEFVYSSLRCGLVHQGTAKCGLWFYCLYEDLGMQTIAYSGDDDWVYFDVVRFAKVFVDVAETIWRQHRNRIVYLPLGDQNSVPSIDVHRTLPNISTLGDKLVSVLSARSSTSAFTPDSHLNSNLRLPRG